MNTSASTLQPASGTAFRVILWAAQILLAAAFCLFGFMKLTMPIPDLAKTMHWASEYSPSFVRLMGAIDLAGGLGVLLPSLTRIMPRLAVTAAVGCALLQICAAGFHISRGEASLTPLNAILLGLSLFVLWGRARKAPILPRA